MYNLQSHLLKNWPNIDEWVLLRPHQGSYLTFTQYSRIGDRTLTAEALDLFQYEIHYLTTHPFRHGPRNLIGHKKTTDVYFECTAEWARTLPPGFDRMWTFPLAMDMLRTVESFIASSGLREVKWSVWHLEDELVRCFLNFQWPYELGGETRRKGIGGTL
ncbi:hypothetical protein G7Y79_00030g064350 [Physcia stellaris]|nr:hypothetical protein G7Y79_00030g064350 [Physcia stellaris]